MQERPKLNLEATAHQSGTLKGATIPQTMSEHMLRGVTELPRLSETVELAMPPREWPNSYAGWRRCWVGNRV